MKGYIPHKCEIVAQQIKDSDFEGDHPNDDHVVGVRYDPDAKTAIWTGIYGQGSGTVGDWLIKTPMGSNFVLTDKQFRAVYIRK